MHRVVQSLVVMRAVGLGNHDAGARRKSRAESDQHVDDAAGAADRRKRLLADKTADDHRIDGILKLLKQQPDGHRDRKLQKLLPDNALRHIRVAASRQSHRHPLRFFFR